MSGILSTVLLMTSRHRHCARELSPAPARPATLPNVLNLEMEGLELSVCISTPPPDGARGSVPGLKFMLSDGRGPIEGRDKPGAEGRVDILRLLSVVGSPDVTSSCATRLGPPDNGKMGVGIDALENDDSIPEEDPAGRGSMLLRLRL